MEITYGGIVLRPWTIADATPLSLIANNKSIADNLRDGFPFPYTLRDAKDWLGMILPENFPPRFFAITVDREIVGSIALASKNDIYRLNCEVGYFIAVDHWGKGIATKAIKAITAYGFSKFEIIRIYAEPFADNIASRRVLEKAGYRLEVTFRKNVVKDNVIRDSCIYSVLKEEFTFSL